MVLFPSNALQKSNCCFLVESEASFLPYALFSLQVFPDTIHNEVILSRHIADLSISLLV